MPWGRAMKDLVGTPSTNVVVNHTIPFHHGGGFNPPHGSCLFDRNILTTTSMKQDSKTFRKLSG